MEITGKHIKEFGLIGYPLGHSFSAQYFNDKFQREHIAAHYQTYPLQDLSQFPSLCRQHAFCGLNVTFPHKENILRFLDELSPDAAAIGAVNVIHFADNKRIGYNTDSVGFRLSIAPLLQTKHSAALILGTGGAAKAVRFALQQLGLNSLFVSRNPQQTSLQPDDKQQCIAYQDITHDIITKHLLIVNCTPLGMEPDTNNCPPIPYHWLTHEHILYDVIYNPKETLFLRHGREQQCQTHNGLQMLYGQAQAAWNIWNNNKTE